MADISMCHGVNCAAKEYCYRYKAKANGLWQTYFNETPNQDCLAVINKGKLDLTTKACINFWMNDDSKHTLIKPDPIKKEKLTVAGMRGR